MIPRKKSPPHNCGRDLRLPLSMSTMTMMTSTITSRHASLSVIVSLAIISINCCLFVSSFQVVTLKHQQQQQVQNQQAAAASMAVQLEHQQQQQQQQRQHQQQQHQQNSASSTTALAVHHQHKRHNLGQELNFQHQTSSQPQTSSPKSAKSNHRLVSKLKDVRHRRRNRHNRHRHYQKMSGTSSAQQGQQDNSNNNNNNNISSNHGLLKHGGQSTAAAAAAFAAMTAMAAEPNTQAASATALTALESIVEEVSLAGAQQQQQQQQQVSASSSSPVIVSSPEQQQQTSRGHQQQQQQHTTMSVNSSPSISGSELLLNGGSVTTSVTSNQQPQMPATVAAQTQPLAIGGATSSPQVTPPPALAPSSSGGGLGGHHLTRGPLHSTRSFLLTSTLSKIYNLLNVTEFALEMRDGISSRASCVACNAVVGLFLSPLYSKEVFSAAIRTVCISFRIQSARVCAGLVESFQDDFEYIRKNTKLTRDEVCGVVFGVDCARRQTYNLFWTIPIPEMPAQNGLSSTRRPQDGSQSMSSSSTLSPHPIPSLDEHSLTSMDDAPDLFEYRKSNIAAQVSPSTAIVVVGKEQLMQQASNQNLASTPGVMTTVAQQQQQANDPAKQGESQQQQQAVTEQQKAAKTLVEQARQASNKLAKTLNRPQYIFDDEHVRGGNSDSDINKLSTFVHLTDIHIDPYYEAGSLNECNEPLCCRATSGPLPAANDKRRQAGRWGDFGNCDVPVRTLRNALERISEKHPNAEYWLWTGDISPHDIWNITKGEAANHVRLVTKMVRDYSNGLPVFPVIGNHEAHPVNSFSPPEIKGKFSMSWLYDLLADEWSDWLPAEALRTLRIGGYYKLQVRKGLRILALNTNYCARLNPWSFFDPVDPASQLKWLVEELLEAEFNQDKVHLIGHVPPDNRECTQSWLFNFINIVDRFRDTILAQFYGHTHRDEWRVIYSLTRADDPIGIQYIGPSITPFTENNPAYRIYHQDRQGYIHDSETYYFNLTEANETPTSEPKWRYSYSHKHHLNMTQGLNAQSFHQYLQRLHDDEDTFDMFHKNFYRFSDVKVGQFCKNKCKQQLLSDLRLWHPYKTKPKPFLSNRKTSNHHHGRDHRHHHEHHHLHHHRRLRHQD